MASPYIEAARQLRQSTGNPLGTEVSYQLGQLNQKSIGERSFLQNIAEAFKRGQSGVLADVAIYEAMQDEDEDIQGALNLRKRLQQKQQLDPVEGRYLSSLLYKSAGAAGQIFESTKRSIAGGGVGAAIGAGIGGVIGLAIPTVGEEPITVGAGAWLGAKVGGEFGAAETGGLFMYKQGVGAMYADMLEQGIEPRTARRIAQWAGLPYAALEVMQLGALAKPATKLARGTIQDVAVKTFGTAAKKLVKTYGLTLGKEVGEEVAQEVVQNMAENVAKYYKENGISVDKWQLADKSVAMLKAAQNVNAQRLLSVGKGAAEAFALLPIPGAIFETGISWANNQIDSEMAKVNQKVNDLDSLQVKDVTDPSARLYLAIRDVIGKSLAISEQSEQQAYKTYVEGREKAGKASKPFIEWSTARRSNKLLREQESLRKEQRAERLGKMAGDIRTNSNAMEWRSELRKALKGEEYAKLEIQPLQTVLPVETLQQLKEQIRSRSDLLKNAEAANLDEALDALFFQGKPMRKFEIKYADKLWGQNVSNQLQALSTLSEKGRALDVADYLAIPKMTAASMDLSRTLRQNITIIGRPKHWFKALARDTKLFLNNETTARRIEKDVLTTPEGQAALKYGIRINEYGERGTYATRAESFPSQVGKKIPGIARSERAYVVGGNVLRINLFGEIYNQWKGLGKTDKEFRDLAHVVNLLTGEGDAKALGKYAPFLNAVFFAPRLFMARVQSFTDILNPNLAPAARWMLAKEMAKFLSINTAILGLASTVPGVSVETDPRSTDFGKMVMGNTHLDFLGGYLPIFRTMVRLATQQRKTQGGNIVAADTKDTITRFLQSKLGPAPAAVLDLLKGETFYGEERNFTPDSLVSEFYDKFTPLFFQDLVDAIRYEGLAGFGAGGLAFLGAGVQTYPQTKGAEAAKARNSLAQQIYRTSWDELGPEVQKYLRATNPDMVMLERQAQFERSNNYFMDTIEKQLKASQKRVYQALPKDIQKDLDELGVVLSGAGRRVGTNWYLNDKRYKEYESSVIQAYRASLPKLMRSPVFQRLNVIGKAEVLKRVTDELKSAARKQIIWKANLSDLHRMQYGQ